jgi:hypothetical protein
MCHHFIQQQQQQQQTNKQNADVRKEERKKKHARSLRKVRETMPSNKQSSDLLHPVPQPTAARYAHTSLGYRLVYVN